MRRMFHKLGGVIGVNNAPSELSKTKPGSFTTQEFIALRKLVDADYYVMKYPDVATSNIDPVIHYLEYGWKEHRDPSPHFSTDGYLRRYPELLPSGICPLLHLLRKSVVSLNDGAPEVIDEGSMRAAFDPQFYLSRNPDVARIEADPFHHYARRGWREGRNPHPQINNRSFLDRFPQIVSFGNALPEPVVPGAVAGPALTPSPEEEARMLALFDRDFYLQRNPDVAKAQVDPFHHYVRRGWKEGRDPHPQFSTQSYLWRYPHLTEAGLCPLLHAIREGTDGSFADSGLAMPGEKSDAPAWPAQIRNLIELLGFDKAQLPATANPQLLIGMFSPLAYRTHHGISGDETDLELLTRYLLFDFGRGLTPGPLFDAAYYRSRLNKADLIRLKGMKNDLLHWLDHGVRERIVPNRLFDTDDYARLNSDLSGYPGWLFEHWLKHGIDENRRFSSFLSLARAPFSPALENGRSNTRWLLDTLVSRPGIVDHLMQTTSFARSTAFADILAEMREIEPYTTTDPAKVNSYHAPLHDAAFMDFSALCDRLPRGRFDNVVLMPFCKLGGSDFVAATLAATLAEEHGSTIIIRTDRADWERPDWFPPGVPSVDLSDLLNRAAPDLRKRMLYEVIRHIAPRNVFNVNSRLAFETFGRFGARMTRFCRLYVYYFCADRTPDGVESGYPVWYFAPLFQDMAGIYTDNHDLMTTFCDRYQLDQGQRQKVHVLYTPAKTPAPDQPVVDLQVASMAGRRQPVILWAGRLDRQKRFDLVIAIARAMPDVVFKCWGKAVLDADTPQDQTPDNLILHPPFTEYSDLPLAYSDGWLYTAEWDGLPTILIECGMLGLPIVASAVGGVPELITPETGWPVTTAALQPIEGKDQVTTEAAVYVAALREMLRDPQERRARARRLQMRVAGQHSKSAFSRALQQSGVRQAADTDRDADHDTDHGGAA
jgi:glycosyltransferase involved in cell wall biosynthesis